MKATAVSELAEQYLAVLNSYRVGDEAAALGRAYDLGREAVAQGVVHLVAAHRQALGFALERAESLSEVSRTVDAAAALLLESMAVVEMVLRGYQEANDRLRAEIVEHQKTQAELETAREAAEAATLAKSQFLANMSHEIRTPLNAIIGMTELVLKSQLSAGQREFLTTVRDSGDSLLTVINDILDFSKIEVGRLVLEQEPFDLRESLGDTMKSFAIRAHQQGLELASYIHTDVPPLVIGDYHRLRQIIVNLVGNAIKFTEHGEVVLEVGLESLSGRNVRLHFTVSDTGIGIPVDKRSTIFEMFEQADSSMTRRHGGTGLGLAIASRLVELMGGRIWVESEVGQGSRFHFTAGFALAEPQVMPALPAEPAGLRGVRVLVVDDHATNRRILTELLQSWMMLPTTAPDAKEGMELLRQADHAGQPYRLVVTDAHMPGFDGFQLAAWIKNDAHLSRTVIAMLTSGDHPEDMSRCEQLGIAAYLLKPAKQSEILTAIERALGIAATGEMLLGAVSGRPQTLRRLRILLVEDSLVNQKLAVALLEEQGHAVTVAGNGRDALAAIESERFDLVLMDLQMPEMDGLEATSRIRQREQQTGSHLPIVAMTAHALAEDRQRCLEAGMDGYIAKPIRSGQLSEAIGALFATPALPTVPEAAEMAGGEDVDWSKALAAVHNNHRSLRKVVEAALQEFPRLLAAMRKAVDDRDAMSLRLSAHTLKGALRVFGQGPGLCETCRLEEMGLRNELADAGGPLAALEMRIAGLAQDLQDYLQRGDTLQR